VVTSSKRLTTRSPAKWSPPRESAPRVVGDSPAIVPRMDRTKALLVPVLLSGCVIEDDSCIAEGSLVATPDGLRAIESLMVGGRVLSLDPETGESVVTRITRIVSARRECVALRFGPTTLRCTPTHPIFDPTDGVFAPASEWVEGRRTALLAEDRRRVLVDTVLLDGGLLRVFDITVAHPLHNFIVEGVLVHNKSYDDPTTGLPPGLTATDTDGSTGEGTSSTGTDATTSSSGTGSTGSADSTSSTGSADSSSGSSSTSASGSSSSSG